jgi:hypothetical protein
MVIASLPGSTSLRSRNRFQCGGLTASVQRARSYGFGVAFETVYESG